MLLVAVGVHSRTLSGSEEEQLHAHIASCEACRALTHDTEHDRPRRIARSSAEPVSAPEISEVPEGIELPEPPGLPTVDPGRFARGAVLARGGMGRITRARDRRLGREVALKEVLAPELRARFEREAMITARLQHPAIVPIYEAGSWPDGSAFYTMRLVTGGTLGDAIERAPTLEQRLALLPHVIALTEALAYAHSRRVVHRDLKPANVLVDEFGETVVIDWGLAKELDRDGPDGAASGVALESPELTRAGAVVGTPCYLAPEQAAGEPVDERADVYSLGAILYHLLVGHPPYWDSVERSADRLIAAALQQLPTPIDRIAPRVPADLRAIAERAMARDKTARFPTAKDMAEELRRFETGQLLRSREYRLRELLVRWIRQHRAAVMVGAIAVGVLAIGGAVSVRQIVARERETRRALAEAQLERGRQLVVDGGSAQGAAYLAAALTELPDDPVALRLAAIALRDVDRRLGSFAGTAAAFRRDGGELAIGQADGTIQEIDPTGEAPRPAGRSVGDLTPRDRASPIDPVTRGDPGSPPRGTLPPVGGPIAALAYSDDGARLAVAARTGAYLRDARTGAAARITDKEAFEVLPVPGDRFAFTTKDAVILVGIDGKQLAAAPARGPHGLALSRDGAQLAAVVDGGAIAWRTADLEEIERAPAKHPWWFAATVDRGHLITAGMDGVRRWPAGDVLRTDPSGSLAWIDDHTLLVNCSIVDLAAGAARPLGVNQIQNSVIIDATHALTGGFDRTLRIWDLERPARPVTVLEAADAAAVLRVDPTGRRAVSRGSGPDARFELWNVANVDAPIRTASVGAWTQYVVSDHRDRVAIQLEDSVVLMTATLEPIQRLDGIMVAFRPGHDELLIATASALAVYSSRNGTQLSTISCPDHGDIAWIGAYSTDGAAMVISCERSLWVRDRDGDAWRAVTRSDHSLELLRLALDDRGHLFIGHADGALAIWDVSAPAPGASQASGKLLATQRLHAATIHTMQIRGNTLFSFSADQSLRQWAIPSGELRERAYMRFDNAAVSPSGAWVAMVNGSANVSLWDSAKGRLMDQLPAIEPLSGVDFLDDDHVIVSGKTGRLEIIEVSGRRLGPPPTASEVIHRVGESPRWRVESGRVVERP
jgi:WD40 repeat protein/tRNA A-37 threonylcarbamoyl transferase component Bud32